MFFQELYDGREHGCRRSNSLCLGAQFPRRDWQREQSEQIRQRRGQRRSERRGLGEHRLASASVLQVLESANCIAAAGLGLCSPTALDTIVRLHSGCSSKLAGGFRPSFWPLE
mmetsp:Transcript_114049/g.207458  ORF Transcript_114049/g.207458 Transcript_114049/m.207458 type:complete len:113 (-) Transcript_114049:5-343(-)